jgi:adenylosuccinate synthase
MPAIVVIGAQWGDEGKGKIVDHLAERASMVVRYQGGTNAGHTVTIGDTVLRLHQVPSGITRPQVAAVLAHGMVINPSALVGELDDLEAKGISTRNLHISPNAHLILPYHLALDAAEEALRGPAALGTTLRGIGPAYTDKVARRGLRVQDLIDPPRFRSRLQIVLERTNLELTRVFGREPVSLDKVIEACSPAGERLAPFVEDTGVLIQHALGRGDTVLLEGAQATMLDIDYGTYPYVTSSSPSAAGACQGSGIGPTQVKEVLGVVKVYTSRVGMGPFPTELKDDIGDWIVARGNEYGTTTGRRRRCGWADLVSLRYAARVNGFTGLALTRLDVLTGLSNIKMCVAYRLPDGSETADYPLDTEVLAGATPVYETMAGWEEEIGKARAFEDLPATAQAYCRRLSGLMKVPIDVISVGAERNDLIALRSPS